MTLNLLDFYKDLLAVFDIEADEQGRLFIRSSKTKLPITIDGKPLVLPTRENIENSVEIKDGKPEITMIIFNPLKETATKGENKTLLKFKDIMERKVNHSFAIVGEVLFSLLAANLDKIENPELISLIQELNKYKAPGIKHIVDENTAKHWVDIYTKLVRRPVNEQYLYNVLKRGGKIGDKKFNRTCTLTFPVYEKLNSVNPKKETFYDVKIRNKDKSAYMVLHKFTFDLLEDELLYGHSFGSENKIAPAFESILISYGFVKEKINNLIDILKEEKYDVDYLEEARLKDLPIKVEDLGIFIEAVKSEIKEIPSENELELNAQIQQTIPTQPQTQQTIVNQAQQSQQVEDEDPINKILNNIGANNPLAGVQRTPFQPQLQQPAINMGMQQTAMNQMIYPTGFGYGNQPMMNPGMNQGFMNPGIQPMMNPMQQQFGNPMLNQGLPQQNMNPYMQNLYGPMR